MPFRRSVTAFLAAVLASVVVILPAHSAEPDLPWRDDVFLVASVSFWVALGAWWRAPSSFLFASALVFGALSVAFGARLFGGKTPDAPG